MDAFSTHEANTHAAAAEIDRWLQDGGLVIAASDRAARSYLGAYHGLRQKEGLTAWPTPRILDWKSFLRDLWGQRSGVDRLLLNSIQEQSLWSEILRDQSQFASLLEGPRQRLAELAMEAHELLSAYAPRFLEANARRGWAQDTAAFSNWLAEFDQFCLQGQLLSQSRLATELTFHLQADSAARPPLLLVGFDRILPTQRIFFDAWGRWQQELPAEPAEEIHFYEAADFQTEAAACARWCALAGCAALGPPAGDHRESGALPWSVGASFCARR
jgi:hypothetical protein